MVQEIPGKQESYVIDHFSPDPSMEKTCSDVGLTIGKMTVAVQLIKISSAKGVGR
jgi:hypothetical protein